jgi:nicotinamide-nucleotide amidase
MATGAKRVLDCDWAIAATGIAGPGGATVGKEVGLVWIAWTGPLGSAGQSPATKRSLVAERFQFDGDREAVQWQSVNAALQGLLAML